QGPGEVAPPFPVHLADVRQPASGGPLPLLDRVDPLLDHSAVPDHRLGRHVPDLLLDARLRGQPPAAIPGHPAPPRRAGKAGAKVRARWPRATAHGGRRPNHSPPRTRPPEPPRETTMSAYKEFNGKSVEEALKVARDEFGVELSDLDFEILTPGSRGVLGMGAEPARIVAAPRSALGGAAPKREAAAAAPLPPPPPREDRGGRGGDRGGWRGGGGR